MNLTPLKERILDYVHHLTAYDYIAYGWLAAVLVGLLLLSIALIGKKTGLSLLLILFVLLGMMAGPFGIKYGLDHTVRKVVLTDTNTTQLTFAKNLIVVGEIANRGKVDMQGCRVFVNIVRKDPNRYKQLLWMLKPLRRKSMHIQRPLKRGSDMDYRVVFDHFAMQEGTYIVRQSVECY